MSNPLPVADAATIDSPNKDVVELAALPARVLAAIVDYIILTSLFVLALHLSTNPDWSFLFSFAIGAAYFTLCHSGFTKGQTIGKRAFGLRVVELSGAYLGAGKAFLRYSFWLGGIILASELPPVLYREASVSTSVMLLEFHILLVMAYFFVNATLAFLDTEHRTLYDRALGTLVVRGNTPPTAAEIKSLLVSAACQKHPIRSPLGAIAIGCIAAAGFWSLSLTAHPDLEALARHRYEIEHDFPIRILSGSRDEGTLKIEAMVIQSSFVDSGAADASGGPSNSLADLAIAVSQRISGIGLPPESQIRAILLTFYGVREGSSEPPAKSVYRVELPSFSVSEQKPQA